jgi:O-antigen ligase
MISNINLSKHFFSYGVGIFPLLLLIGPLISELFLVTVILFTWILIVKKKQFKYLNKYFIFFSLFYLSTLFSTLLNFYHFDNAKAGIFYFRIPLFAFAIWFVLDHYNIFNKKIVFFYTIFFCLIIFDALLQFYTGQNLLGNEILRKRISSFFGEELILGSFITRILPFFLLHLIMNDIINQKINIYYTVFISFICLIVYLSGERTSFFLLVLFFSLVFITVKDLRKFIFIVGIILFFLSLLMSYFKNSEQINPANRMFSKTYAQLLGKGGNNEEHKKKLFNKVYIFSHDHHGHYLLAAKIIKDHPIFGVGVKGFRYLCRKKIYILENNDGCSTHPHNTYLQVFSSNGVIGFIFLVTAFIYLIRQIIICRNKIEKENNFNKLKISQIIMLITVLINFWPLVPSGNFFNNWLSMLYFYPIGYYLYFKHIDEKKIN